MVTVKIELDSELYVDQLWQLHSEKSQGQAQVTDIKRLGGPFYEVVFASVVDETMARALLESISGVSIVEPDN